MDVVNASLTAILSRALDFLTNQFWCNWQKKIGETSCLLVLSKLKTELTCEPFVCYLHNRKQCSVCSSTMNRLDVESRRYRGLPCVGRVCSRCDSKDVDAEEHCLLWCNSFDGQQHCTYTALLEKANIQGVSLIQRFLIRLLNSSL